MRESQPNLCNITGSILPAVCGTFILELFLFLHSVVIAAPIPHLQSWGILATQYVDITN